MATGTYKQWFTQLLTSMGFPVTQANLDALADVTRLEGLNDRYNPLNSVVPSGASTAFNSVGVQDYGSWDNGLAGTTKLLQGSAWTGVDAALARGDSTADVLAEFRKVYAGWDPGVQFPTYDPAQILADTVGTIGTNPPPPASSSTQSTGNGSGGTVNAQSTGFNPLSPITSLGTSLANVAFKVALVLGGVGLVAVGLFRASGPAREGVQQQVESAAPIAAAAAV